MIEPLNDDEVLAPTAVVASVDVSKALLDLALTPYTWYRGPSKSVQPELARHRAECSLFIATSNTESTVQMTLEALETEVFRLSPSDRSRLLEHLIASFDVDEEMEAAWDAITDQREAAIENGTAKLLPFAAAIARLETRFAG